MAQPTAHPQRRTNDNEVSADIDSYFEALVQNSKEDMNAATEIALDDSFGSWREFDSISGNKNR